MPRQTCQYLVAGGVQVHQQKLEALPCCGSCFLECGDVPLWAPIIVLSELVGKGLGSLLRTWLHPLLGQCMPIVCSTADIS